MSARRTIAALVVLLLCGFAALSVEDGCDDEGSCQPDCQPSCTHGCGARAVFRSHRALAGPAPSIGEADRTILPFLDPRCSQPEPQPPRG